MFDALGDLVAYQLLGLDPASRAGAVVHFFFMDVAKIFALLVLVIYAMGLLRAPVSPERVREVVSRRPDWQAPGLRWGWGRSHPSAPAPRSRSSSASSRRASRSG